MPIIVPAILESSQEKFQDKVFVITRLLGVTTIQVDFCDGQFVPSTSVTIDDIEPLNPTFSWEAHLMIQNPSNFVDYKIAGFHTVVIHYEAYADVQAVHYAIQAIVSAGLKPALAVNPDTAISVLDQFQDSVKQYTLLSVEPGRQGSAFIAESIDRLHQLRKRFPNAILEIDGGIKAAAVAELGRAGADVLVVGSALFETPRIQENFDALKQALETNNHT
jgi:ribulose-phosphate 3-epimerase